MPPVTTENSNVHILCNSRLDLDDVTQWTMEIFKMMAHIHNVEPHFRPEFPHNAQFVEHNTLYATLIRLNTITFSRSAFSSWMSAHHNPPCRFIASTSFCSPLWDYHRGRVWIFFPQWTPPPAQALKQTRPFTIFGRSQIIITIHTLINKIYPCNVLFPPRCLPSSVLPGQKPMKYESEGAETDAGACHSALCLGHITRIRKKIKLANQQLKKWTLSAGREESEKYGWSAKGTCESDKEGL